MPCPLAFPLAVGQTYTSLDKTYSFNTGALWAVGIPRTIAPGSTGKTKLSPFSINLSNAPLNTFFLSGLIRRAIMERFNDSLISDELINRLLDISLFIQLSCIEIIFN